MTTVDATHPWAFDRAVATRPAGRDRYLGDLPPEWEVLGGPVNGGLVQAACLSAIRQSLPAELPDPLTSTGHFLAPTMPGPFEVHVQVAGTRRRHATASATLVQGERERVRVLATFGNLETVTGPSNPRSNPPKLPPVDQCEVLPDEVLPPFLRRFDIRYAPGTSGGLLGRTAGHSDILAWVRFADRRPADSLSLAMFTDCLPPAVLNAHAAAWVPTIELTAHVRGRPAPGWLRLRFATAHLVDGYLEEDGEVWDTRDRLVAQSRQLARLRSRAADGGPVTPASTTPSI